MLTLGIDPGTHRIGWAVVEKSGTTYRAVSHGCLDLPPQSPSSSYLPLIHSHVSRLLEEYKCDALVLETLLFQKNLKTAVSVAEARGVILLAAATNQVQVKELAPNTIKQIVTGYGASDKKGVARMVGLLLGVNTKGLLDDRVDALAIAYAGIS